MLTNGNSVLKTGDWIKGKLRDGQLIIGYIESQSILDGVVKVTVATSDDREALGKTISILSKNVRKLPLSKAVNKKQILFLIDLALSTGDEEWFIELSSKLNSINQLVEGVH
ncbi:IDEAL domain-containing protein [Heyndrickxia acidicola]|uniref:IDEAL domain-containing protein n=1 Tax=Heyndrickxia acidicola TaxID=209389 RepID=A0ABU6MIE6_9BACI|nr:IDEAL domain-containing protein [Heyndrickxia acidicola]MED1204157.1 IDEAL domain-containing protein [Heyndrickxia acidicola]